MRYESNRGTRSLIRNDKERTYVKDYNRSKKVVEFTSNESEARVFGYIGSAANFMDRHHLSSKIYSIWPL